MHDTDTDTDTDTDSRPGTRPGTRPAHRRGRVLSRRRGSVLLEFVMVLPMMMYMVLIAFDLGRAMVIHGALSDGAFVAARSNAQIGVVNERGAEAVFNRAVKRVPGVGVLDEVGGPTLQVTTGDNGVTTGGGDGTRCTDSDSYIQATASKQLRLMSPGLGQLYGAVTGSDPTITTTAQVLCEVVRGP